MSQDSCHKRCLTLPGRGFVTFPLEESTAITPRIDGIDDNKGKLVAQQRSRNNLENSSPSNPLHSGEQHSLGNCNRFSGTLTATFPQNTLRIFVTHTNWNERGQSSWEGGGCPNVTTGGVVAEPSSPLVTKYYSGKWNNTHPRGFIYTHHKEGGAKNNPRERGS